MSDRYDEHGNLTDKAHKEDHIFLEYVQEKAKKRSEMIDKVKTSIITSFIWTVISGVGAIIWYAFNQKVGK